MQNRCDFARLFFRPAEFNTVMAQSGHATTKHSAAKIPAAPNPSLDWHRAARMGGFQHPHRGGLAIRAAAYIGGDGRQEDRRAVRQGA